MERVWTPVATGGYEVLPDREWFETSAQARVFMATGQRLSIQEAQMAERESPMQEYERRYRAIRMQAQALIREISDLEMVRLTNPEIAAAVAAAELGAVVGDSTLTKESAEAALALLASFQAWVQTEIAGVGMTPLAVVYRRD